MSALRTPEASAAAPAAGATAPLRHRTDAPSAPGGRRGPARALLTLARPRQWLKNPVAIAPALVSMPHWSPGTAVALAWATVLFTLASVAVYVLNDILDRHRDGLHPVKRHRPLAGGDLSVGTALAFLALVAGLFAAGVALASPERCWPVLAYLVLNLAYSLKLKHVALIDAFTVALGFALRTLEGYVATGERESDWMLLGVFCVCLLMVFGKRRHELAAGGAMHRPALKGYSVAYLDHLTVITATLATAAYLLLLRGEMALAHGGAELALLTVPCALLVVFRYLHLLIVRQTGGDPVRTLLGDRTLLASAVVWAALLATCIALTRHPLS